MELVQGALLVIVLLLTLVFLLKPRKTYAKGISPPLIPLIGHTFYFASRFNEVLELMVEYFEKNDWEKCFGIEMVQLGPLRGGLIVVPSVAGVKHILKDNFENYEKGDEFQEAFSDFLGNGIFTTDGAVWKLHRKVAAQMFSKSLLRLGTNTAQHQILNVCERIDNFIRNKEAFNLQKLMFAFTMDTFTAIAFGVELNSIKEDHPFAKAFDRVQLITNDRFQLPIWKLLRLLQIGTEKELTQGCKLMKDFALDVIAQKRRIKSADLGPDLLSRFVDKGEMSDEEMIDVVLNFMIAGRDTTASNLSWAFYELLNNEKAMKWVQEEIDSVFESRSTDSMSYEDLFDILNTKLPRTRAVVFEALRMHPSVAKELKFAKNDDTLPDGSIVKAGQGVFWCPYAMGRNPKLWEDPNQFKPERWMTKFTNDTAGKTGEDFGSLHRPTTVSDYDYPMFNAGPRLCLGRPLAILEGQLGIATLLSKYKFKLTEDNDGKYLNSLVSPLKKGVNVTATLRK
jgi:cytochrome P450